MLPPSTYDVTGAPDGALLIEYDAVGEMVDVFDFPSIDAAWSARRAALAAPAMLPRFFPQETGAA